jgi:Ca2+-transporting ATPase
VSTLSPPLPTPAEPAPPERERDARPPHALTAEAAPAAFGADAAGFIDAGVEALRAAHGFNELAAAPPVPWWRRAAAQFRDLVIWVLLCAAAIGVEGLLERWSRP